MGYSGLQWARKSVAGLGPSAQLPLLLPLPHHPYSDSGLQRHLCNLCHHFNDILFGYILILFAGFEISVLCWRKKKYFSGPWKLSQKWQRPRKYECAFFLRISTAIPMFVTSCNFFQMCPDSVWAGHRFASLCVLNSLQCILHFPTICPSACQTKPLLIFALSINFAY